VLLLCQNLGVLPRPEGKWEDIPLPMPEWDRAKMDNWTTKKALFGQNDYIGMCERNLLQINNGGWFDLSG